MKLAASGTDALPLREIAIETEHAPVALAVGAIGHLAARLTERSAVDLAALDVCASNAGARRAFAPVAADLAASTALLAVVVFGAEKAVVADGLAVFDAAELRRAPARAAHLAGVAHEARAARVARAAGRIGHTALLAEPVLVAHQSAGAKPGVRQTAAGLTRSAALHALVTRSGRNAGEVLLARPDVRSAAGPSFRAAVSARAVVAEIAGRIHLAVAAVRDANAVGATARIAAPEIGTAIAAVSAARDALVVFAAKSERRVASRAGAAHLIRGAARRAGRVGVARSVSSRCAARSARLRRRSVVLADRTARADRAAATTGCAAGSAATAAARVAAACARSARRGVEPRIVWSRSRRAALPSQHRIAEELIVGGGGAAREQKRAQTSDGDARGSKERCCA